MALATVHDFPLKAKIILSIACLWVLFDYLNILFLNPLQIHNYLYAIYWLAGFRLMLVILFGWIRVIGACLGYIFSGIFFRHFEIHDAVFLGILSSIAPFIAFKVWIKVFKKSEAFLNVRFIELFYLILLSAILTGTLRTLYLISSNKGIDLGILMATFAANISGSILFLFGIKALFILNNRISKRS
jgi:hypothetical protein